MVNKVFDNMADQISQERVVLRNLQKEPQIDETLALIKQQELQLDDLLE